MRSDDFNEIEQYRIPPPPGGPPTRRWQGSARLAVADEEQATRVADALHYVGNTRARWRIDVSASDNIVLIANARYQERSADSRDIELLIEECVRAVDAVLLAPIAISTVTSYEIR